MKTVGLSFIALRARAEGRLPTSLSLLFFEKLYSTFVVIVGGLVAIVAFVTIEAIDTIDAIATMVSVVALGTVVSMATMVTIAAVVIEKRNLYFITNSGQYTLVVG